MKCPETKGGMTVWQRRCVSMNYRNEAWLRQKYLTEKLPQEVIGKFCGVDHMTIMNWMKKFGIKAGK